MTFLPEMRLFSSKIDAFKREKERESRRTESSTRDSTVVVGSRTFQFPFQEREGHIIARTHFLFIVTGTKFLEASIRYDSRLLSVFRNDTDKKKKKKRKLRASFSYLPFHFVFQLFSFITRAFFFSCSPHHSRLHEKPREKKSS